MSTWHTIVIKLLSLAQNEPMNTRGTTVSNGIVSNDKTDGISIK